MRVAARLLLGSRSSFPLSTQYLFTSASVFLRSTRSSVCRAGCRCDEADGCGCADWLVAATPPAASTRQRSYGGPATATVTTATAAAAAIAAPAPAPVHGEPRQRRRLSAAQKCGSDASPADESSLTPFPSLCAHGPAAHVLRSPGESLFSRTYRFCVCEQLCMKALTCADLLSNSTRSNQMRPFPWCSVALSPSCHFRGRVSWLHVAST